ncbi:MAG: response regulator [Campylobacterota bacterium]
MIRILYAEDEKSTREFVKILFKKVEGIEVTYAVDGKEALELYKQTPFELVATDVYMPNMDGFELIHEIKKIEPAQIFIMMTAMEEKEDLIKAISLRINLFLTKPLDKQEFLKVFEVAKKIVRNKKEHAKLQEEFNKQHKTFEHLLSKQKSLLCITDFTRTVFASDSFLEFFDISEAKEFDTKYDSLLHLFVCHPEYICASSVDELLGLYEQSQENKRFVWLQQNNHYRSFKLDLELFEDGFYIVTLTDVSYLKQMQDYLNKELEDKLSLIQQQEKTILQQSKLAAMGEMLDAVAHQWQQPLNIIKMQSDFLRMMNEEDIISQQEIDQTMQNIISQTNHLEETLREFRSFFRPVQSLTKVETGKLLESVLTLLKDELLKNCIEVTMQGDLACEIAILPNEFKHVFINLLNNSKDAYNDNNIEAAQRRICIFVEQYNDKVIINVQDRAGGIPKKMIDTIFEPHSTSKEYGTGIGLYMTKQIVNKINGTIVAKNFRDGAAFKIELQKGGEDE